MAVRRSSRPILLFLDWDSTLTASSTLPFIASIGTHPDQHPQLDHLSEAYASDLTGHDERYPEPPNKRTTVTQEYTYLNSLERVESASINRIQASGIFQGVDPVRIQNVAFECLNQGKISLRNGWLRILRSPKETGNNRDRRGEVHVISVAWSARFIQTCLKDAWPSHTPDEYEPVFVHANDIDPIGSGKLLGSNLDRGRYILVAHDKYQSMQDVLTSYQHAHETTIGSSLSPRSVYIGDSLTDLMCLMDAHVGICMCDDPVTGDSLHLQETLNRLQVKCLPIDQFRTCSERDVSDPKILWLAFDLDSIVSQGIFDETQP